MRTIVAEIDIAELAVRMCEASYGLTRPCDDARTALMAMDEEVRDGWLRAATVAAEYFRDAINGAGEQQ